MNVGTQVYVDVTPYYTRRGTFVRMVRIPLGLRAEARAQGTNYPRFCWVQFGNNKHPTRVPFANVHTLDDYPVLRHSGEGATFWCPGCKDMHHVTKQWGIDFASVTLEPSVLVTTGHYAPQYNQGDDCWCTYNAKHPDRPSHYACYRCHSFVRNGMIQFLGDCTHELANKTVKLQPFSTVTGALA